MENFWEFAKIFVIANAILFALFLILLALPQSKMRKIFLKVFGIAAYFITGLLVLYIVNPIDLIPDILPLLGQTDDIGAALTAIFSGATGWISIKQAKKIIDKQ